MLSEVLVIGFVETAKGQGTEPFDPRELAKTGAHDILWLTYPGPNEYYCADLTKRFDLKDKRVHAKPRSN